MASDVSPKRPDPTAIGSHNERNEAGLDGASHKEAIIRPAIRRTSADHEWRLPPFATNVQTHLHSGTPSTSSTRARTSDHPSVKRLTGGAHLAGVRHLTVADTFWS
jgi:hypothetical protein